MFECDGSKKEEKKTKAKKKGNRKEEKEKRINKNRNRYRYRYVPVSCEKPHRDFLHLPEYPGTPPSPSSLVFSSSSRPSHSRLLATLLRPLCSSLVQEMPNMYPFFIFHIHVHVCIRIHSCRYGMCVRYCMLIHAAYRCVCWYARDMCMLCSNMLMYVNGCKCM